MRRREFFGLIGGAAAWPLTARAQPQAARRIGVISAIPESDPEEKPRRMAFQQGLEQLGWASGRNLRIDFRWNNRSDVALAEEMLALSKEMVALEPEVILVQSNPGVAALRQVTSTIPIVFVSVADPVESGFVESLARPGGNITGFSNFEASMGGKWLEALKQIAPGVTKVLALLQVETAANAGFLRTAQSAAASLGVNLSAASVHDAAEIETALTALSTESNCGLIVMPHPVTVTHREVILKLATRYRLPAVYAFRYHVAEGGLMSYGIDLVDLYRRAATYVDRILRGAKPRELPVQAPSKFEMVINLKTAKALGLDVPLHLQQLADEVIE
jgi:putative tryptophan/tyrosine transport system substrate-binding protein